MPLATLRDCFALLVADPDPLALDGTPVSGLPDRLVPLDELRDRLLARSCPQATSDTAWKTVIRRARARGGAWTVGAAGMALPALRAVAFRLGEHSDLDPADVQAEVLTGFLSALAMIRLDLPRIAVRLRWAAYRAGLDLLTQSLEIPYSNPGLFLTRTVAQTRADGPYEVLAVTVVDGVLTETEAALVAATRLGDVSVASWAARHATPVRTAYRLRDRAEQRLLAHLTGRGQHASTGEPSSRPPGPTADSAGPATELRPAGVLVVAGVSA
ncbi:MULTISPECIES: hypothetical protein [unclassified Frankia]|uniref:hypothetical protein n=1 Tax=unclassified Frankia TaxID=2632575 RepID=UPI001F0F7927|nr:MULTISPECIES: hypothetical protein [unclassified Frankia]